jgi:hypothetical protein
MSPPVVFESDSLKQALALPQEERRKLVTQIAAQQGAIAGLKTALVWTPAVAYLQYGRSGASNWFRTRLNVSGKTAFLIMPIISAFGLVSEQVATRMANPRVFESEIAVGRASALPIHQRMANFVHDNPIRTLIMVGVPGVVAIFLSNGGNPELSLSQRIMHTRVAGQFTVLTALLGTMGIHDYMSKRGRFLEPWEELAQKEKVEQALKEEEQGKLHH